MSYIIQAKSTVSGKPYYYTGHTGFVGSDLGAWRKEKAYARKFGTEARALHEVAVHKGEGEWTKFLKDVEVVEA